MASNDSQLPIYRPGRHGSGHANDNSVDGDPESASVHSSYAGPHGHLKYAPYAATHRPVVHHTYGDSQNHQQPRYHSPSLSYGGPERAPLSENDRPKSFEAGLGYGVSQAPQNPADRSSSPILKNVFPRSFSPPSREALLTNYEASSHIMTPVYQSPLANESPGRQGACREEVAPLANVSRFATSSGYSGKMYHS